MRQPVATLSLIALSFAAVAVGISPGASAQEPAVEEQIVDAFQTLFGKHPGQRVNHAKGIVAEGSFKASPDAAALTRAVHFQPGTGTVPVTVRFSNATGLPNLPDGDPNANPHGMAVKFRLPDGSETDMVINSLHFFPVATPAEFRDLLLAVASSKPDSPEADAAGGIRRQAPGGRTGRRHRQDAGKLRHRALFRHQRLRLHQQGGRNQFHPLRRRTAGRRHLSRSSRRRQADAGLPRRRSEGPAGEGAGPIPPAGSGSGPGDPITDATIPWPADRKRVELGVITVTALAPDNEEAAKSLLFLPGNVTDGVAPSDDPLIAVRDASYAISFSRRSE